MAHGYLGVGRGAVTVTVWGVRSDVQRFFRSSTVSSSFNLSSRPPPLVGTVGRHRCAERFGRTHPSSQG